MDWTAGYVADVEYGAHYFPELDPARLPIAFLNAGYAPPRIRTACELGFGMGVSLNVHAATNPEIEWHGTDFNPTHAAFANQLAEDAGLSINAVDDSFAEYFAREDLPDFDLIVMHGVWSWVSQENRDLIVDFLRRKLKVGGVVYVSYNCLPGWAPYMPLRQLFFEHAARMSPPAESSEAKVEAALTFVDRLLATTPAYASNNPSVAQRMSELKTQAKPYLAHEYLNREWKPMYFSEVADAMGEAKLEFMSSAGFLDFVDDIWLSPEQSAILAEAPSTIVEQTLRDYMVNQQFRRDIWIKGGTPLSMRQRVEALKTQRVSLVRPLDAVPMKINLGGRSVDLQETIYRPVLDALNAAPSETIEGLARKTEPHGLTLLQVVEAVVVLIGSGSVAPARQTTPESRAATARLNAELMRRAEAGDAKAVKLVSPITGPMVDMDHVGCLMAAAWQGGSRTAEALAEVVWRSFAADNRRLIKAGAPINKVEDNLTELEHTAERFLKDGAAIHRKLGVLGADNSPSGGHKSANKNR